MASDATAGTMIKEIVMEWLFQQTSTGATYLQVVILTALLLVTFLLSCKVIRDLVRAIKGAAPGATGSDSAKK